MRALTDIGNNVAFVLLLPFLAIALTTDISRRHISNLLIAYMLVSGVVLQAALFGMSGLIAAVGGLVVGLVVLLPFYALGGMGAGDVKLLAAAGTFLGPEGALLAGVFTLAAGGVLALAVLAWYGLARYLRARMPNIRLAPVSGVAKLELPYSLAIAAGTLIAAYNTSVEPFGSWVSTW